MKLSMPQRRSWAVWRDEAYLRGMAEKRMVINGRSWISTFNKSGAKRAHRT
jgi:hypothetical protein